LGGDEAIKETIDGVIKRVLSESGTMECHAINAMDALNIETQIHDEKTLSLTNAETETLSQANECLGTQPS
jgi:hypothetical protein